MRNDHTIGTTLRVYAAYIAGVSIGSLGFDFFAHPFFTIWTLQQTGSKNRLSMRQAFKQIRQNGGFYAGFSSQAVTSAPAAWLYILGRKLSIEIFGENDLGYCMQGVLGIALATIVWSPAMRITMSEQVCQNGVKHAVLDKLSPWGKCKHIYTEEGMRGLYRGTMPFFYAYAITDIIGSYLQAHLLRKFSEDRQKEMVPQTIATTIAFLFSAWLSSPYEVIFARQKLAELNNNLAEKTCRGATQHIYKAGGIRGFFRGFPALGLYTTIWHLVLPTETALNQLASKYSG